MEEVWRPIKEYSMYAYDGGWKYEVSNLGRVRRAGYCGSRRRYYPPRLMKSSVDRYGYQRVIFTDCTRRYTLRIHRLVASAFLIGSRTRDTVVHIDGNKTNNRADNLKYLEQYKCAALGPKDLKKAKPVRQYTLDGKFVREYASASEAQRLEGYEHSRISSCCRRMSKTSYGFIWRFVADDDLAV